MFQVNMKLIFDFNEKNLETYLESEHLKYRIHE